MSVISILITTIGIFGTVITVFFVLFQVKKPIIITKRDTIFIIMWLFLFVLGCVNIYYTNSTYNEIVSNQQDYDSFNEGINDQSDNEKNEQNDKNQINNNNVNNDFVNEKSKNLS